MTEKTFEINLKGFAKHWALLSIIFIFLLSFSVRTSSFNYNYLLNVDSYFQYRYIGFVEKYGEIPPVDYYMSVPEGLITQGDRVDIPYHWVGGYSYLLTRIFFPGMELWQFLVYFPALLACLMVIPAYYIGKILFDKKAGVILAFLISFNQNIFMRSIGGDPDTDAFVILLSLITMALFLFAFKEAEKINSAIERKSLISTIRSGILIYWKVILLSASSGILLTIFAYSWVGYWYIFYIIIGYVTLKVVVEIFLAILSGKAFSDSLKKEWPLIFNILVLVVVVLFTLPLAGPLLGHGDMKRGYGDLNPFSPSFNPFPFIGATELKAETGNYPNVFVSVQEMMSGGDYRETANRAGIGFFAITLLICIPYLLITYWKNKKHLDTALLISLWFFGAFFAATFAVRFGILLAIPVSIGTAIVIAKIWRLALGEDKEIFE